ncbi:MAG: type 4a pilus biogenesis protein PilO [candidate division Zixibacteria bacterium]|nr:type 4a pilus biogenesis protein PilO [candidate division Zixibacteria bacterium]
MKKNLILSAVLALFILGFWMYYKNVIEAQPANIVRLQNEIAEKKRQLLSAQILSRDLHNVNDLIQYNLAENLGDSLAQSASIPFLKYLTALMDRLDVILISMKPLNVINSNQLYEEKRIDQDYIEIPYSMSILASYKQLGKFLEELEKYPRLINVTKIQMENPLDIAVYEGEISGKPDQHKIDLEIQTITILKASFKGGSQEFK